MCVTRDIDVMNPAGLHARPAARFAELARTFESAVTVAKDGRTGNAKSLIGLLKLNIETGSTVTIQAQGPDEQAAVAALAALLSEGAEPEGAQA
jgi:phosphotransferase system HPr (HPr) family protein